MSELISFLYEYITSREKCFETDDSDDFPIKELEIRDPSIELLNQLLCEEEYEYAARNDNIIAIDINRGLMMTHQKRELRRKMFRAY